MCYLDCMSADEEEVSFYRNYPRNISMLPCDSDRNFCISRHHLWTGQVYLLGARPKWILCGSSSSAHTGRVSGGLALLLFGTVLQWKIS